MTIKRRMNMLWRARCVSSKKPWNAEFLAVVIAGYNNLVHSALPSPYTPADVLDALFDDPNSIIEKVKSHQDTIAGREKTHYRELEPEPVPRMALALPFSSVEATCRWRPLNLGTRSLPIRRLLAHLPRFAVPAAQ